MRAAFLAITIALFAAADSFAHYNMLFPDKAWAKKDEKVVFTYQFGHPFEHELFDAPKPASLMVHVPSGKLETLDIDKTLTKIELPGADGKKITAWRFDYTPAERGDHVFLLKTARIQHEEGKFIEDTVKVILHVQTQNGWDWDSARTDFKKGLDIVPYTRPYGLRAGMAFRARLVSFPELEISFARSDPRSANRRIEIERYNPTPAKMLPPDELITFGAKSEQDGFFTVNLPDAGWWGITAIGRDENEPNIIPRATLWVHVDEKK